MTQRFVQIEDGLYAGLAEAIAEIGRNRLGTLVTPDDLQSNLQITQREYEELLTLGLPFVRFGSGEVRHPETAVEEFFRQMGDASQQRLPELVGTPYVAERLGISTVWVTQLIHDGAIPPSCIAPGTGNGKPWKFFRVRIDEWIRRR